MCSPDPDQRKRLHQVQLMRQTIKLSHQQCPRLSASQDWEVDSMKHDQRCDLRIILSKGIKQKF